MRVLVFSMPRTCSSYVIHIISKILNIENYNELYQGGMTSTDLQNEIEEKLYKNDNYAIKFMSPYFSMNWLNMESIRWDIFDKIIFTERDNVTDHICSWYAILSYNQDLHDKLYNGEDVVDTIQDRFFDNELISYKNIFEKYIECKKFLKERYPEKCITLKYEMFQKPTNEYAEELKQLTGMDFTTSDIWKRKHKTNYKKVFPNYDRLDDIVKEWNINYDD